MSTGPTAASADLQIATVHWRGNGPPLLLAHATGFCAAIWNRLATPLSARHDVFAYDQRGHGDSSKPVTAEAYAWEEYAGDCLAVLDALGLDRVDAAGHSSGAATLALAAARAPERFGRLVLIEPIIFPPLPPPLDPAASNPLAEGARRRRMVFDSAEDMCRRLGAKPPMDGWDREVLADYVTYGSFDRDDGRRELKCPGEIEAFMYEHSVHHRGYDALCELESETLVLAGDGPDSPMPPSYWQQLSERIPKGSFDVLTGLGHFAPMQDPDRVQRAIAGFVEAGA